MSIFVHTANLGGFDVIQPPEAQVGVEMTWRLFGDADFPPRPCAMTRRLQAKIPKMFGWDLAPGYDTYVWHDASLRLSKPDSVAWLTAPLANHDLVIFRHPWRTSIAEEADYLRTKLANDSRYIIRRYYNEDLDGQMRAVQDGAYVDDHLYAGGCFAYRPTTWVKGALTDWWVHTSRFHCIDQLALPYVLAQRGVHVAVIDEDIYHSSHLEFTRAKGHG